MRVRNGTNQSIKERGHVQCPIWFKFLICNSVHKMFLIDELHYNKNFKNDQLLLPLLNFSYHLACAFYSEWCCPRRRYN